ncbi:MAG: type II toxin-antitoxin system HicA family toxin [Bacteroidota bacterium]
MKLPRDVSGEYLVKCLRKIGYEVTRQRGSHVRVTMMLPFGQHHITIPMHNPIKVGTLSAILNEIATAHQLEKEKVIERLFG